MTTTQFLKCMTPFFNIRLTLSRNEKKELEQKKKEKRGYVNKWDDESKKFPMEEK